MVGKIVVKEGDGWNYLRDDADICNAKVKGTVSQLKTHLLYFSL